MSKHIWQEKNIVLILWVIFFCYSTSMALLFQNVIVPNIPSLNGVGHLLPNDAVYFDSMAWALAEEIRLNGWSSWQLFVTASAPGNVSILAALYALFGHDSTLIIPVNAGLHALGGILMYSIAKELAINKKVGIYAGLIAGTLFIIFPSALNWYGQVHKDGYAIAGTLLMLLMWLRVINGPPKSGKWVWVISGTALAIILIGIVRPYGLTLLLLVTAGALFIVFVNAVYRGHDKNTFKQYAFFLASLVMLLIGVIQTKEVTIQVQLENKPQLHAQLGPGLGDGNDWKWEQSSWLPDRLESYISAAAKMRASLISHGRTAGAQSTIDDNVIPASIGEVVQYLPRSLQVAALAPFPSKWFSELSVMRMLAAGEMFIYYLCIPGIVFLFWYDRRPATWMTLYFAVAFLTILGFTIANMGSLYRIRYAYLLIMLLLGVVGWITLLDRKGAIDKIVRVLRPQQDFPVKAELSQSNVTKTRKKAVGSGIYVITLTLASFLGFFYRDVLVAQMFGLGAESDGFFMALLIPMTVVTIICIPLGAAFTPVFIQAAETKSKQVVQELISSLSATVTLTLALICSVLYFSLSFLLPYLALENMARIQELTLLALPILFFSGSVILGNAVLNAMGKVVTTGIAQLAVPIIAILAVMLYQDGRGIEVAVVGMVVGQLLNLIILQVNLKKYGYSLSPKFGGNTFPFAQLSSQYFPLTASAFFVSIAILINTSLATSIPDGGVSVYNLGNKVVLLVTGLVGAAISTVMLPYFANLVAKSSLDVARRELSLFLLFLTFFSIPISVVLFVWAEPIIQLIFEGGEVAGSDIEQVARVMRYAVVQIPFFACNVLILKFATATKHVLAILNVAILGLLINVGASLLFMQHMGVAGIALGASLSMILATAFLLLLLARYRHISIIDTIVLLLNWLLFITLLMSIHFGSLSGITVTILAYCFLLVSYGKSFFDDVLREKKALD